MNNQKIIVMVAHTPTFLTELKIFGNFVKRQSMSRPIYLLAYDNSFSESFISGCRESNDECRNIGEFRKNNSFKFARPLSMWQLNFVDLIRAVAFYIPVIVAGVNKEFLRDLYLFKESEVRILSMLKEFSPEYLILGGDMPGYDSALYVKLAKKLGIPSFVIPSTMSNGEEQAEVYFADSRYHATGLVGILIAKLFPRWCKNFRGIILLRVPISRMLAMLSLGLDYDKPWIFNSSKAEIVFLESEAMKNYYHSAGLSSGNLVVTGSPTCDRLYSVKRNQDGFADQLVCKYSLSAKQKTVLVAFPPDFFYVDGGRPQSVYKNHEEVVTFFSNLISSEKSVRWLISLHPSMKASDFKILEESGAIILEEPAYLLMPLIDVFIATVSSTIRWAISCGVPVINFDFYRYKYSDFMDLDGVLYADSQEDFLAIFSTLISRDEYFHLIKKSQERSSVNWGRLDGDCCFRIHNYIQNVTRR
jgi:hypothetical protein